MSVPFLEDGHSLPNPSSPFHIKYKKSIPFGYALFVARRKGLEPLTFWFVARHSIQLS